MDQTLDQDTYQDVAQKIELLLRSENDPQALAKLLAGFHPADVAEALSELPEDVSHQLFSSMQPAKQAEVLDEAAFEDVAEIVAERSPALLAPVVAEMPPDEAADLLEQTTTRKAESILSLLPSDHARAIRELRSYPPDTAGGIMNNDVFFATPEMTKEEIRAKLKQILDESEQIGSVMVAREDRKFIGQISAEDLISADPGAKAGDLAERATVTVSATADQEICARYMAKYDLNVLPVLDPARRLLGVITVDDILEVMDMEASEDMYRLAGVGADRPLQEGPVRRAFKRLPWFVVTILGMSLLGLIISRFQATLEQVVAVSFFMPAIMGLGGNVGVQASTITVRGLAMNEIEFKDIFWLLRRELVVAVIIGCVCSCALALVSYGMTQAGMDLQGHVGARHGRLGVIRVENARAAVAPDGQAEVVEAGPAVQTRMNVPLLGVLPRFPITVGLAVFAGILGSVMLGTCIPMICHRAGVDPALASGPFVTTLIDIGSQSIYLGLATWLLLV